MVRMPLLLTDRAATTSPVPLISTSAARTLGLRLAAPTYRRIRPGVWVEAAAYDELPPWQKYAVRVHAFALRHPAAVLCLESAAVALGLPLFGQPRTIHAFDPDQRAPRRFGDVQVHASATPRAVVSVGGVLATSLLDTVVDLARVLPPAQAVAVADAAISAGQGGTLSLDALRTHGQAQENRRGRRRMAWVWANADALSESPGETASRIVMDWCGFERPELQVRFEYDGCRDRVDFFFRSLRAIGESDGWGKYQLMKPEQARRLLQEEKRREDRLRRHGHPFARWEAADAWGVTAMCAALNAAGVRQVRPSNAAMLATLRPSSR